MTNRVHLILISFEKKKRNAGGSSRELHLQVLIYTAWNLWEERYRRVFDNKTLNSGQLLDIIKQDIIAYRVANSNVAANDTGN